MDVKCAAMVAVSPWWRHSHHGVRITALPQLTSSRYIAHSPSKTGNSGACAGTSPAFGPETSWASFITCWMCGR